MMSNENCSNNIIIKDSEPWRQKISFQGHTWDRNVQSFSERGGSKINELIKFGTKIRVVEIMLFRINKILYKYEPIDPRKEKSLEK